MGGVALLLSERMSAVLETRLPRAKRQPQAPTMRGTWAAPLAFNGLGPLISCIWDKRSQKDSFFLFFTGLVYSLGGQCAGVLLLHSKVPVGQFFKTRCTHVLSSSSSSSSSSSHLSLHQSKSP